MAEESRPYKKSKRDIFHDDSCKASVVNHRNLAPKITTVATKILLDDAHNGFKKGNLVCSPFSLDIVLGMLAFGAKGQTLEQLLEFLGHETMEQLRSKSPTSKLFAQILSNPNGGDGSLDIRLANGVWVANKMAPDCLKSSYKKVLKTLYNTKARCVDFTNKAKAVRKINSWVDKKTKSLIPTLLSEEELTGKEVVVLANALYFKGKWTEPFAVNMTKNKDFHLISGEKVSVPFMTSRKQFQYGSFEGYQMLKIPYKSEGQSNEFSMYIILPNMKDGLQDLLQVFHSDHALFYEDFNLKTRKLDELWIPKFKISYTFKPSDVMNELGLTLPFNPTKELTGIVKSRYLGKNMLYVSDVLQKSFIEIDESGTKAVATSLLSERKKTSRRHQRPTPPASFVADHPFMFMIREDTSPAVFFIGVVLNPVEYSSP
ncbi:serpin-ZX [Artemisia annua]|uniref:Serpin-ZX n=1 Tax=Artemisia annua TaxID=35608 RepID=A0A2U1Q525_ARTAN|nr:serpin-ZX [Artemisia annua]